MNHAARRPARINIDHVDLNQGIMVRGCGAVAQLICALMVRLVT
jgi:hypothetical protein